jgi:D-2-hydroxyglutarate dehydrogenase
MLKRVVAPFLGKELHGSLASTLARSDRFARVSANDLDFFRSLLLPSGVLTEDSDVKKFNSDWMNQWHGSSQCVLLPNSTSQVSAILAHCNQRKLAVVPQGGNTGLVGGSVPIFDEIVLSMNRMNKIISFDKAAGVLTCESGVVLEQAQTFVASQGFTIPLDLGAKGSCQLGGNVSTNAGGLRVVRYGTLRSSVLGLEVVLANGEVIDSLSTVRKDNTGTDIKQLFIGSEGTLGVVTQLSLLTPPLPPCVHVMFLGVDSFAKVLEVSSLAKSRMADILSAVEFLDRGALGVVLKQLKGARDPLEKECPFYVLIETSGFNDAHDREKVESFLQAADEARLVIDGTVAQDRTQAAALWALRENVAYSLGRQGHVYKYDISLPLEVMYEAVLELRKRLNGRALAIGYGHLGDSNLHLNVSVPKACAEVHAIIEPWIYEFTASHRGSISAEHGLGQMKNEKIHYSKSAACIDVMQKLKRVMDPHGILNPYKCLPTPVGF